MAIKKRGQEEMVGFAFIIIIVAIVLLIFLGIYLNKPAKESVESYEAEHFLYSILGYTTECKKGDNFLSIEELVFECEEKGKCNEKDACIELKRIVADILKENWIIGEDSPYSGYELNISSNDRKILNIKEGKIDSLSKGASLLGEKPEAYFVVYSKP